MTERESQHRVAYLYALAAVAFWSTSATAFKLSLQHIDTLGLLFFASLTSTVVLLVYLILTSRLSLLRTFTKRDYLFSAGLGLLNPFLYYIILFKAYSLLLAQEAQPINFVWPLTLVLLSIPLLGQRIKPASILAILVSFSGVVVIGTHGDVLGFHFSNGTGVLLALSTTIVWSLFWIFNTKDKQDALVRLFLNFAFASLYILVVLLAWNGFGTPTKWGLYGAAYVGLFEMGITFLLWLKALKAARTTAHVVNLIYLVPFLSLLWIAAVLREPIYPSTLVGLVLIVTGIILQKLWG